MGRGSGARAVAPERLVRCALYTRKSTEEGLEQEFNSLDAQRESAEAYVASQRHEGWVALPDRYDDGGFSGGTIERPALRRLLADIEAGRVDSVVVYKVDRLSRSLLDFARMMEVFERHKVSFVSVTQQFNTGNSMGRLMLNVLLSFAQFEREIISERTRDKMGAARRKGKWVGGFPVLGYDIGDGRLVVNEAEAHLVRSIYELYLSHEALGPVVAQLNRLGRRGKTWVSENGVEHHGRPFTKSSVFRLLTNVLYAGKVNHRGTVYPGEHEAIVDEATWKRVQEVLRRNGRTGGREVRNKYGAILKGLLFCAACGRVMGHTYTTKKGGAYYRYYVCVNAQEHGAAACPSGRLPAGEIEAAVLERIKGIGKDEALISEILLHVREESERATRELRAERRALERDLLRMNGELRKVVGVGADGTSGGSFVTDRLTDLQDRIRSVATRLDAIRGELRALEDAAVEEEDLREALARFDPLWESLTTREQCRLVRLLIERVSYDGRTGQVSMAFRTAGLKALCKGTVGR